VNCLASRLLLLWLADTCGWAAFLDLGGELRRGGQSGGMTGVYRATDRVLARPVAIRLLCDVTADEAVRAVPLLGALYVHLQLIDGPPRAHLDLEV
jgi:hypothetical protein